MDHDEKWQDLARQLQRETDPQKRKKLELELRSCLERAGFRSFGRPEPLSDNTDEHSKES